MNNFLITQSVLNIVFVIALVIIIPEWYSLKSDVEYLKKEVDALYDTQYETNEIKHNDFNIDIKSVELEEELPKIDISSVLKEPNKQRKRKKCKNKYVAKDYIKSLKEMSDYVNNHHRIVYDVTLNKFLKIKYITEEWGDWVLHFDNGYSVPFVSYVYKTVQKSKLKEVNNYG